MRYTIYNFFKIRNLFFASIVPTMVYTTILLSSHIKLPEWCMFMLLTPPLFLFFLSFDNYFDSHNAIFVYPILIWLGWFFICYTLLTLFIFIRNKQSDRLGCTGEINLYFKNSFIHLIVFFLALCVNIFFSIIGIAYLIKVLL